MVWDYFQGTSYTWPDFIILVSCAHKLDIVQNILKASPILHNGPYKGCNPKCGKTYHWLVKNCCSIQDGSLHYMTYIIMFGVKFAKKTKIIYVWLQNTCILNTGMCFFSYNRSLFSLHTCILIHIHTIKFTLVYNVILEYNYVSPTNLKESLFGIGLQCHHTKTF